jgi:hypothetical protein
MDCSHGYKVEDDTMFCKMNPADRHKTCMSDCNKAASSDHQDWIDQCKFGCGYWCDVTHTKGHWEWSQDIVLPEDYTLKHGTQKKHSESKTKEWGWSVTSTVEAGFEFAKRSLSSSVGQKFASSTSDEWEEDFEEEWSYHAQQAQVGQSLWQFFLTHTDVCGHTETTKTKYIALTDSGDDPPCCVPGHGKAPSYKQCTGGTPSACKGDLTV